MQHDPRGRDPEDADERAWQAIVDNYGDRPTLDDPPAVASASEPPPVAPVSDAPFGGRFGDPRAFIEPPAPHGVDEPSNTDEDEDERFVPPDPPPVPRTTPDRLAAWIGIFGSPAVLLVALIFSIAIPAWLGYLLIAGFVGGFCYLVMTMSREPRDPWDDGAQV